MQQKDVVKYAMLTFRSELETCKQSDSSFDFKLPLKRDVYYQAVECQVDFQSEVGKAFEEGSQEVCLSCLVYYESLFRLSNKS